MNLHVHMYVVIHCIFCRVGPVTQPVWLYPLTTDCSSQDFCLANCGEECPQSEFTICNYLESTVVFCSKYALLYPCVHSATVGQNPSD